ncbi:MAG: TetM/TetW/TetO/TetS family tetracycline resistance ribosomal protection protein [Ruminococcaceae bacterium]|nr:TetM/TetW/TetO/TetS family tetracycline resistance ribosomal protection protein [Oscillospiraceae bacterium]
MPDTYHNLGILAHVDAGKTTLTEQLLYLTGAVRSAGSVDAGTASTDSLSIEKSRGISVRTAAASTLWRNTAINIIDTPGHVDFAGEVERSISALDYAIVVVPSVEGVRAHTENILKALDSRSLPRLIFINKIDRAGSDLARVTDELRRLPGNHVYLPLMSISDEALDSVSVAFLQGEDFDTAVTEALCDVCDEAAEAFLSDEILPHDRACELLREAIAAGTVTPVLYGSAKLSLGIRELADFLVDFMPSSERLSSENNALSGVIFKIEHDKTMGKISYIRMFGGQIKNRDAVTLLDPAKQAKPQEDDDNAAVELEEKPPEVEKISQIRRFQGARPVDAGEVTGGDIAALCGLSSAKTGQFVGSLALGDCYKLASPYLRVRVTPKSGDIGTVPKLAEALHELSDEEPYIDAKWENGQREITINTTGRIQLEVIDSLLRERYNLEADFSPPTVIYKETPARAGFAYADYTMPKPCWAVVQFKFEPMPRGYGVSYHGKLPSNQCFYKYQTHIRTSFNRCLEQGLYGWEVTDFKCTLVGGQHHTIHTHPLDFFVCTPMAFMNGMASLGSTLLEPLLDLRISAPAGIAGKIITEIVRMGGEYETPSTFGDVAVLEAIVPAANYLDFPAKLASMSSGKAVCSSAFRGYRECTDGVIHENPRRGVNPLDRAKWILWARGAITTSLND